MLLLSTAIAALFAQGPGPLVANVDDPLSHGTLGDAHLSLDEALQLANGTLSLASLSASEQARVTGGGTAVTSIVVDAAVTPTITFESSLVDFDGQGAATGRVTVMGVADASGAKPVLAIGANSHAFFLREQLLTIMGVRFEGGERAIVAEMPDVPMTNMDMAMVGNCEFDGQTVAAVRLTGTANNDTRVMVNDSTFTDMPLAFLMDDQTVTGQLMSVNERIDFDGVTLGCRIEQGGMDLVSMWMLYRSVFQNGDTLVEARRMGASTQQQMVRLIHSDAYCNDDVLDIEGNADGLTIVHHHHGDFVAPPGKKAFWVHPRTAAFDVHGSEMLFEGDVFVSGNLSSPRFWQQNNRYRNGVVTYDIEGALPNLLWNLYDDCEIHVPSTARSPVALNACQLQDTDVDSASFLAPVTLDGCVRSGGAVTGFASEHNAAPGAFLGVTDVSPEEPQVGSTLVLQSDVPFGIGLIWDIAVSFPRPVTADEPVRFYGDPATVVVLPAVLLFQSTMNVPIPNDVGLVGLEFYVQGISVPLFAQPHVPPYHLPRGSLVRLRD